MYFAFSRLYAAYPPDRSLSFSDGTENVMLLIYLMKSSFCFMYESSNSYTSDRISFAMARILSNASS